ncbi:type II toxin-antitoxin system Phd/YefM family antitoxin [Falsiroseomonas sp. CW058]|uniref:type II toxin-antitoxin system Phd/YefM family antitoxin n=1 Tax=Falsiroseomonas sp. CW058 TaxID=3388664 RepID=UPI003D311FD7
MMDGTVEARPEWKDLLDRIRQGETLTVTEGGRPVATLAPAMPRRKLTEEEIAAAVEEMRATRDRNRLDGISWKELRDEGRR